MKLLALLLLTCLLASGQGPNNRFLSKIPDDAKHLMAGAGISFVTASLTEEITDDLRFSIPIGFAMGVGAGILKEVWWDRRLGRGTYNPYDMLYTGIGSFMGTGIFIVAVNIKYTKEQERLDKIRKVTDSL